MKKEPSVFCVISFPKRLRTLLLCTIVAAAMFYLVNYPAAINTASAARQLPIYCVQRDQKVVAISFDAAWGNEDTQQIIDILKKYQVPATFFVVGEWVDKYPESVKALHDAGHQIMNHSNTHAHYPQLSASQITADLNACNDKIEAVTGVRPTLVRLPYGDYDDKSINAVRSIGMEPIQWDVDGWAAPASTWAPRHSRAGSPGTDPNSHALSLHFLPRYITMKTEHPLILTIHHYGQENTYGTKQ